MHGSCLIFFLKCSFRISFSCSPLLYGITLHQTTVWLFIAVGTRCLIRKPYFIIVSGVPFPKNFLSIAKTILKRLFRVYAHIYHQHFPEVVQLGEEAHLNTSFKHFIFFVQVWCEFRMWFAMTLIPNYAKKKMEVLFLIFCNSGYHYKHKTDLWLCPNGVVNIKAVYAGEPSFMLSLETSYPESICGFLLSPSKHTGLVPQIHFWTCPFSSFPVNYSAILSLLTVYTLQLWNTLLNELYTNVIADLVEFFSLNSNAQAFWITSYSFQIQAFLLV